MKKSFHNVAPVALTGVRVLIIMVIALIGIGFDCFGEITRIDNRARELYLQGQNYERQINSPEAERCYKQAATTDDQDPVYLNAYALILQTVGRYTEAEPLFRRALVIREKRQDNKTSEL